MNAELLLREFDRLSEAPDAVSRCRQAILDLAVQGQLHGEDAHEWPRRTVAEVLDSLQTGPFGSSLHQTDYESGGTPVINPASIQDGRIIPIPKMAVGPATLDRLASFKVSSNDVVMARRGEMADAPSLLLASTGGCVVRGVWFCTLPKRSPRTTWRCSSALLAPASTSIAHRLEPHCKT